MISKKTELIMVVTIFAIILTACVYIFPSKYALLWLSLEVIIIPTLYLVGYELLIHKQRKNFERDISLIVSKVEKLEKENYRLKIRSKK
tara:strand:- start:2099 stop:2365 length:267 start_codon:yes stop_codon:yes gene_type:complete